MTASPTRARPQRVALKNDPVEFTSWSVCGPDLSARLGYRLDRDGQLVPTHVEIRSTIENLLWTDPQPITASALREVSIPALVKRARMEMRNAPEKWPWAKTTAGKPGPASRYTVPAAELLRQYEKAPRGSKLLNMYSVYASYGCPLPPNEESARRQVKRDLQRARALTQASGGAS